MHNGFVRVDDEKMSKSLGNFFTIRDVLKEYAPEVVRFFILRAHYRSPLNYSDAHLVDARQALSRLYTALRNVEPATGFALDWSQPAAARFKMAMDDDFNTAEAIAVLFDLANEVNRNPVARGRGPAEGAGRRARSARQDPRPSCRAVRGADDDSAAIEARIAARIEPRRRRTLPRPTASVPNCWPKASRSRIRPRGRSGAGPDVVSLQQKGAARRLLLCAARLSAQHAAVAAQHGEIDEA
jgi:cysteinyl-tRNA synthetase